MKAKPSFSLKDQLFNAEKVAWLARRFARAYPAFPRQAFRRDVVAAFPELELKERIAHIATCLRGALPDDYNAAVEIILRARPPELDPTKSDGDFGDFIIAPLGHFVALNGCTAEHLETSLRALHALTRRFSMEDAVRYFLNAFPDETLVFLHACAEDENYHVRRLASEGTRAKLPWAQKLDVPYGAPLPILDKLYADPTRYVTRSVANHLNVVSKLDPPLVLATLERWQESGGQEAGEMAWMTTHALRTLTKRGDQAALAFLGFGGQPDIAISDFTTSTPVVKIGEALQFTLTFRARKAQKLVVDYLMEFAGDGAAAEARKGGRKVFKLKQLDLEKGQVVTLRKKHPMRLMTTRPLYAGEHRITLQVNGQAYESPLSFELEV